MRDGSRTTISEYRLHLDVDPEALRWEGAVEVDVGAGPARLELDAEDLDIRSVQENGETCSFDVDAERHRLGIPLRTEGTATVRLEFGGRVDPARMTGLYRCRHGEGYVLTTQCEPISARRIFPCVDRPDAKAPFRLTVRAPASLEVVSNTPPATIRSVDGHRLWSFAPTPPMSTYLLYLAMGAFDRVEASAGRVTVRVLTPPGRAASGQFAADAGARILRAYESYYDIPYPLPKLDMIAVSEHAFGAMENWGAMSFRDVRLLVEPSSASFARSDVFETVCHEIAHQWFGNLVTMANFSELWLNESFATFLEAKITDQLEPAYESFVDFIMRPWGMGAALQDDALTATHPVRNPIDRPEAISETTDAIAYGKGASLLRMLDAYLGDAEFRAGVTDYLKRFKFGNARTEDLWAALGAKTGTDVAAVIGPWIERPGHPLVRAELVPGGLHLTQERFSVTGPRDGPPWPIPLRLDVDGKLERLLFTTHERTVPLPAGATVHLNPGAVGFFRTRYDEALGARLLAALPGRPAADRWILLADLAALVTSGDVDWATYERAVRAIGVTRDRLIVEELVESLSDFADVLPAASPPGVLARWYLRELTDLIGLDRRADDPASIGITRERVLQARVRADPEFAREIATRFADWDRLDPDLRWAVAIARARTGGDAGYREIAERFARHPPEGESTRLEVGLAWSDEVARIQETLDLVRAGGLNRGHIFLVLRNTAMNPVGRPLVGPWLEENLPKLDQTFRGSGLLSLTLEGTIPLTGLGRAAATHRYFREHPYPEATRGIAKGLEQLEIHERLVARLAG